MSDPVVDFVVEHLRHQHASPNGLANDNGTVAANASRLLFDIRMWDLRTSFQGEPPPERWLVSNSLPLGEPGLLVAMGDTGKGMLGLELALRVAYGRMDFGCGPIFGGQVETFGNVVILTAEDSQHAIHRRIRKLDPDGSRQRNLLHRMAVVPLPNAGGSFPLIIQRGHEISITPEFSALREELKALQPRLVILDPLQSFCHADINADPTAGAVIGAALTKLGAELEATILVAHHMRKPDRKNLPETASDARDMIRGTSALVDNVRFAYVIWPEHDAKKARAACDAVGRQDDGHSVYRGGIAKANGTSSRALHTLVRDPASGVLRQLVWNPDNGRPGDDVLMEVMVSAIAEGAATGHPYAVSARSQAGIYSRRATLPPELADLGPDRFKDLIERAEKTGRIVQAKSGSKTTRWLDVPDGKFAHGIGTHAEGAMTGKPGRKGATHKPFVGGLDNTQSGHQS